MCIRNFHKEKMNEEKHIPSSIKKNKQMKTFTKIFAAAVLFGFKSYAQTIPNANFECVNTPDSSACNWGSDVLMAIAIDSNGVSDSIAILNNRLVGITHDAHTGSNALEINNYLNYTQNICYGMRAAVSTSSVFSTYQGGMALTSNPTTFEFFYKYISVGGDSAIARLDVLDSLDEIIGTAKIIIGTSANTFMQASAQVVYTSTNPAVSGRIIFSPSVIQKHFGSSLVVDDLSLNATTSVSEMYNSVATKVYPNPAKDIIQLKGSNIKSVEIVNAIGEIMLYENTRQSIDISNLSSGIYFVKINHGNETEMIKLVVE